MTTPDQTPDWAEERARAVMANVLACQDAIRGGYTHTQSPSEVVAQALRQARAEALDQVLAGIAREQNYREYREDQDGSGIGTCKEIASYVRTLKNCDPSIVSDAERRRCADDALAERGPGV